MEEYPNELARTLRLSNAYLMRQVERTGLSGLATSHGDILVKLFACDEMCMSGLSERIGRDPSTVTALVKKLVGMGLAETRKDPHDRRTTLVRLTDRGRALEPEFKAVSDRLVAVWHEGIDDSDLQALSRVLSKVQENLKKEMDDGE